MAIQRKHVGAVAIALTVVAGFEGLRTAAYRDPVGIPTVCFGETRGVHMGDTYTKEQCLAMLTPRVEEFAAGVDASLTVPVPDKSRAAFYSFSYNLGIGVFRRYIAPQVNAGDLTGACHHLTRFIYAAGVRLPGLVKRRSAEEKLCLEGAL